MNQLLDRHFAMVTLERSTLATYQVYADKHMRPLIGRVPVSELDADVFDSFYAELRRCRDHCTRRQRGVDHRTSAPHEFDARCTPHECHPLGASTIRQIHFIRSGSLKRAVRWRWLGTSPIAEAEPPRPRSRIRSRPPPRKPHAFCRPRGWLIQTGVRSSGSPWLLAFAAASCVRFDGATSTWAEPCLR